MQQISFKKFQLVVEHRRDEKATEKARRTVCEKFQWPLSRHYVQFKWKTLNNLFCKRSLVKKKEPKQN